MNKKKNETGLRKKEQKKEEKRQEQNGKRRRRRRNVCVCEKVRRVSWTQTWTQTLSVALPTGGSRIQFQGSFVYDGHFRDLLAISYDAI